ncbi:acidic proline-rich protein PRP25-like [Chenopodium quinoa]|uniref:acidic proline-rich protein PRP25-like n=1 Tax=Chenopodium quinoa TaxID=63459 RepID=UPI000B787CF6|nr:acidic proline-rich protein PRP25-like [Chenopodium quinoa]
MIQQTEPLPSFETARSRLLLEKTRRSHDSSSSAQSFVAQGDTASPTSTQQQLPPQGRGAGTGRGNTTGRGGKGGKGRGRGRGQSPAKPSSQQQQTPQGSVQGQQQWPGQPQWAGPTGQQPSYGYYWAPVPSQNWVRPPYPFPQPQPRGQQAPPAQQHAYLTAQPGYGQLMTPTELGNAFSTMTLVNPDDGWYMDWGASSHMTYNSGSTHGENNHEV